MGEYKSEWAMDRNRRAWKIVNTDNFGRDYPDERFVENLPLLTYEQAKRICAILNADDHQDRYFKMEEPDYHLQPGFEP